MVCIDISGIREVERLADIQGMYVYREQAGYLILKTNNYYGTKEKKRCY